MNQSFLFTAYCQLRTKMPPNIAHASHAALENAQSLCEDLYVIVGIFTKRVALFSKIQDEIEPFKEQRGGQQEML